MKKSYVSAYLRVFLFAALLPAMSLSFMSCEPESETDAEAVEDGGSEDNFGGNSEGPVREAVDLGLSVKWASCNVGADSPEDYGDYFAWGETETKENYDWSTYKWCNGSSIILTKYCTSNSYGTVDNKTVLDLEDDVAHVKWGDGWRMPTLSEIEELIDDCTWEKGTQSGIDGYKVSGPNGNSIFLPAAGYRVFTEIYNRGSVGYSWSATLYERFSDGVYGLLFYGSSGRSIFSRCYGYTVRPVTE